MLIRTFCVASIVAGSETIAMAQGVRCSAFLLEHDGSWRSFEPGAIIGPRGEAIEVETGQRFRRGRPSTEDFVARVLDARCRRLAIEPGRDRAPCCPAALFSVRPLRAVDPSLCLAKPGLSTNLLSA